MIEITIISILEKIILGINLAAPIGPVSIEMLRRGLQRGALAAFTVRLGGALGNTLCLLSAFFGLSHIAHYPWILTILGLLGVGFLFYTGLKALLKHSIHFSFESTPVSSHAFLRGFYLSLANPMAIVFWSSIYAASASASVNTSFPHLLLNMLIIVGVLLWGAFFSFLVGIVRHYFNEKTLLLINKGSGLLMLCFGLKYLWTLCSNLKHLFRITF